MKNIHIVRVGWIFSRKYAIKGIDRDNSYLPNLSYYLDLGTLDSWIHVSNNCNQCYGSLDYVRSSLREYNKNSSNVQEASK